MTGAIVECLVRTRGGGYSLTTFGSPVFSSIS
jgi:hypothetical protein